MCDIGGPYSAIESLSTFLGLNFPWAANDLHNFAVCDVQDFASASPHTEKTSAALWFPWRTHTRSCAICGVSRVQLVFGSHIIASPPCAQSRMHHRQGRPCTALFWAAFIAMALCSVFGPQEFAVAIPLPFVFVEQAQNCTPFARQCGNKSVQGSVGVLVRPLRHRQCACTLFCATIFCRLPYASKLFQCVAVG